MTLEASGTPLGLPRTSGLEADEPKVPATTSQFEEKEL